MSKQIPARKSWYAYWWRWAAWIGTIFILITIDQIDFLGKLSPDFKQWFKENEPSWMQWSFEVRGFSAFVLIGSIIVATIILYFSLRKTEDGLRAAASDDKRGWGQMLTRHIDILTEIKNRGLKNESELEDWRTEADAAVNKAEEKIRASMGASYATRFMSTGSWIGEPASGNVNKTHRGYRAHLEQYIKNLIAIFDGLGH